MSKLNFYEIKTILSLPEVSLDQCSEILAWIDVNEKISDQQKHAREILFRLLDRKQSLPQAILPVLFDYVENLGYYPYLEANKEGMSLKSTLHYEFFRSENIPEIVMHQKQAEVYNLLSNERSVILSAPTSFGKSLIIEEIVASNKYNNIVIILPTLALIDEVRQKLSRYAGVYKLIFTTKQRIGEKNIFILTPEKFIELENFPQVEFFIIDEFYKVSYNNDDDERVNVLNHVFYKLMKQTKSFYLLGPNIDTIPNTFEETYGCEFLSTNYATVATDEIYINRNPGNEFEQLKELLDQLEEPTLIYCQSPASSEKHAKLLAEIYQEQNRNQTTVHIDAIEWIKKNIHPEWSLTKTLESKIAFHHGVIPRYLGRYIVNEFNKGNIKYLFCTSTLIEGINTSAKNVVIFENKKGRGKITHFDYKNICGRAGRMRRYFVGNVYSFHTPPEQLSMHVDFPWFTQDSSSEEVLIQLDYSDLKDGSRQKIQNYIDQDFLDLDVIKRNNNLTVSGQIELAKELTNKIDYYHRFLNWSQFPTSIQLKVCCELIWKYFVVNPKDGVFSDKMLHYYVNSYRMSQQPITASFIKNILMNDKKVKDTDDAVQKALKIIRKWFEFRFPKLLLGLEQIQKSIFLKHKKTYGDYKMFASSIESGLINPTLSDLEEFGLPLSLLRKVEKYLNNIEDQDLDGVIGQIKKLDISKINLDKFEKKLLEEFIGS
ncbi:DEAD/DEAH box helicase [Cohnella fermenti]|nr:DEAD/DEAH box helicase [Cohnella fermenti]